MSRELKLEELLYDMRDLVKQQEDLMGSQQKIWLMVTIMAFVGGIALGVAFL